RPVNRSHCTNANCFYDQEIIEHALGPHFLSVVGTLDPCERLSIACVERSSVCRTYFQGRRARFSRHRSDCNIGNFQSNEAHPLPFSSPLGKEKARVRSCW